ncbi:LOW QUALITY PROTEIN: acid sphingomyelinase-like phosphodiesterase 3a [Thrips palmi]|uniref:LOW QUALITY PROTEIN: acid sphingomyelinase-like phosphodiesterase 3a n=1 Tax=Thrips palmi TaxID=161013 RepID=A0A6P9A1N6_THRPL|nr:LOW QUALITY PROTEIN: acid sphingomyelinase-like phosphodiesterase 3a [Thrips palmi]
MRPGWAWLLPGCLLVLPLLAVSSVLSQPSVGHFWHISDLHYDVNYSLDGDIRHNCRRWSGNGNGLGMRESQRPEGRFGDLHCDAPLALLESATTAMKDIAKEVDFVLWTGAGPVSGHDQGSQATQVVTQLLLRAFTSQFVFPVLGPDMRHADHYKQAADLWRNWLPEEAMPTFYKGGYYTIEQRGKPLRIVALNTNLWLESPGRGGGYSRDAWEPRRSREGVAGVVREPWEVRENRVHDEDPAGQWRWLDDELLKARLAKKTVYLVGHTAPGADDRATNPTLASGHGGLLEHHNTRFLKTIKRYSDVILGQFFSNRHSDTFRVVKNDTGSPVSWMLMPPSVTPRRTQGGSNNPGIRLYKYDNTTGSVLDYSQYYLDLARANREGRADWQLGYNLTSYYGMREVNARAFDALAESFTDPELGPASFARYYRANSAMLYDGPENCYPQCQRYHYCAITRLLYSDYRTCLESPASALPASGAAGVASVPLSLLVAILVAALRTS